MPAILRDDDEFLEVKKLGEFPVLVTSLAAAAIVVSFFSVWAVCGICCPSKKKEEKEKTAVQDPSPKKAEIETPKESAPPSAPAATPAPAAKAERIIPGLLKEPGVPIPPKAPGADKNHYFEIGDGASQQVSPEFKRLPPPKHDVPRGATAYATMMAVDQQFQASNLAKKNAAATVMRTELKTAVCADTTKPKECQVGANRSFSAGRGPPTPSSAPPASPKGIAKNAAASVAGKRSFVFG